MRVRRIVLLLVAAAPAFLVAASGCREPTQMIVEVTTDIECAKVKSVSVTARAEGQVEGAAPQSTSTACDPATHRIGSVVLVPSGAKDDDVVIRVVLGVDNDADRCTQDNKYAGCVVARRQLNFIPGATLHVPIVMRLDCKDIPCSADQTCDQSACVSSKIDSNKCPASVCDEGQLDAGAEGGRDAAPDATTSDGDATISDAPIADAPSCGPACTISSLALGTMHTCVVVAGNVRCFGSNDNGQLGRGAVDDYARHPDPQNVVTAQGATLANITGVVSGPFTTCAFDSSKDVWCWGDDTYGQLGPSAAAEANANQHVLRAVKIPELHGSTSIALGFQHTCFIDPQGTVWCMGTGKNGEIGDGKTHATAVVPTRASIGAATALVAGSDNTCAVLAADGSLRCWGMNLYGAIGWPQTAAVMTPSAPPSFADPIATLRPGAIGSCVRLAGGSVQCWGLNDEGFAGHGEEDAGSVVGPGKVLTFASALGAATQIAISVSDINDSQFHMHACAVLTDSSVACWGDNHYSQLGAGDFANGNPVDNTSNIALPVDTSTGFPGARLLVAGAQHTCALDANGALWCWGRDSDGQLGDGPDAAVANSNRPKRVVLN